MLRKSASVKAGAIMFGQVQVAYYDTLKESMPEEQAYNLLAHTTTQIIRGGFSAVGPVAEVLLKAAAMMEYFDALKPPAVTSRFPVSDIVLQEGQVLMEAWHVEYTGKRRLSRPAEEWIECRVVKMYHCTIYGGANGNWQDGRGSATERRAGARPMPSAMTCRRLTTTPTRSSRPRSYRWWLGKLQECRESLEDGEDAPGSEKKLKRRIKQLENMMAEWQEDYDYYPEETIADEAKARTTADIARLQQIRSGTDRRRAASARLRAKAEAGADASQPAG